MNYNNFHGLKDFTWWIGIVENNVDDPAYLGRCQVRVFGYHTDDKQILPTKDLPWAHPVYPCNYSKSFSIPSVGDWILGFFMDGESGQFPIMLGVIPGIKQTK